MSGNGIIVPVSWADGRTITARTEASADLAAENVLDTQPSVPWRSDATAPQTLQGDFGRPRPVTVAALLAHNLTAADTATLTLASDAGYTQDLVQHIWPGRYAMRADTGPVGGDDDIYQAPWVVGVIPLIERRYWHWSITRVSGYTQVGRMMLGMGWQPPVNFNWGLAVDWIDPSTSHRTSGGQTRVLVQPRYRRATMHWSWLEQDDADVFADITYTIAAGNTILVIPYPDALTTARGRRTTILGRITSHDGPRKEAHAWTASTTIEEAL